MSEPCPTTWHHSQTQFPFTAINKDRSLKELACFKLNQPWESRRARPLRGRRETDGARKILRQHRRRVRRACREWLQAAWNGSIWVWWDKTDGETWMKGQRWWMCRLSWIFTNREGGKDSVNQLVCCLCWPINKAQSSLNIIQYIWSPSHMKNIVAPLVKQTRCVVLAGVCRLGSSGPTNDLAVIQLSSLAGSSSAWREEKKGKLRCYLGSRSSAAPSLPLFLYCCR